MLTKEKSPNAYPYFGKGELNFEHMNEIAQYLILSSSSTVDLRCKVTTIFWIVQEVKISNTYVYLCVPIKYLKLFAYLYKIKIRDMTCTCHIPLKGYFFMSLNACLIVSSCIVAYLSDINPVV